MQNMHKLAIALLAIVGVQNSVFAYRYSFTNEMSEGITLWLKLEADGTVWDLMLQPDETKTLDFPWLHENPSAPWEMMRRAGLCLEGISYLLQKRDANNKLMFHPNGMAVAGPLKQVDIEYVESKAYKKMSEAAGQFTGSIGATAGGAVAAAKGGSESPIKSEDAAGIGSSIATMSGYGKCGNRNFTITKDSKGKVHFYALIK